MALLGFMGFDHMPAPGFSMAQYPEFALSTTGAWTMTAGQIQGQALSTQSGGRSLIWSNGVNYATFVWGGRIKLSLVPSSQPFLYFEDSSSSQIHFDHISTDNKIKVYRGGGQSNLIATSTNAFSPNSWIWFEVKATIHNTTGEVLVKIGGNTEINATGLNTRSTANNYMNRWEMTIDSSGSGGNAIAVDDVYWMDTTGSAPYNDIIGVPLIVETTFVTTNNAVAWTPLSSTNASNVDDAICDDDTTYNSTSGTSVVDTFNHGALASSPATIYGAALVSRARKDDVAVRTVRHKLISGATTVSGVSTTVDTTYKYIKDYWLTDPDTGVAWASAAAINATKIGYEAV